MAEKALKSLLKILPCRPAELEKFQGFFIESGKDMLAAKPSIGGAHERVRVSAAWRRSTCSS